ncbi:rhodanese-like domain-containing protein [Undibacterium piscinae]|jgi:phage shock protein E|uniref:Rhodanese-like domain-containing protein n=1 Tax=Undibacterium piscinae TaxID=2495591 RepID=A0A6M4A4H0_9BURK|nr:rhodanese-like domain-containing protein [Undibacterium piscinae]
MSFLCKLAGGLSGASADTLVADAVLIDVRSSGEYASGYIDGAICLPLATLADRIATEVPDKTAAIIVYCRCGDRSSSAKILLNSLGYQSVSNGGSVGGLALKLQKTIRRA